MDLEHSPDKYIRLTAITILLLISGSNTAGQNRWECQAAADGSGWICGEAGELPTPVLPPASKPQPSMERTKEAVSIQPVTTPAPLQEEVIPPKPGAAATDVQETAPRETSPTTEPDIPRDKEEPDDSPDIQTIETEAEPEVPPEPRSVSESEPETATTSGSSVTTEANAITEPVAENDSAQNGRYATLLDEGMAWNQCRKQPFRTANKNTDDLIYIEADAATAQPLKNSADFRGNVIIRQPGHTLHAEDLHFDNQRQLVKVDQQLLITLNDLRLLGSNAWYDLNRNRGEMEQISYRIPSRKARGDASKMSLLDKDHSAYENISYTTCPPGNNGFVLFAEHMEIDQKNQIGTFKAAKLRFLGVPVFYAPTLTVPLNDARKSGILVPSLGYSSKNGLDMSIPYYLNLAPDYDATITPRILSKRGLLLGGDFRFLTPQHKGQLQAEILPDDSLWDGQSTRGAVRARTRSNLNTLLPGLAADLDLNWVSDNNYLDDLGQSLAVTSTRHLRNRAALSWGNLNWNTLAELRHYKTLDDTIAAEDRPYSLLPRLSVDWLQHQGPGDLDYSFNAELSNFYREDSVTGQRIDLKPRASLPLRRDWGFIEPAISARYTSYSLEDQLPGKDSSPSRSTYSLSMDSGLYFDRQTNWFGESITHTLEPRAYYLYTPYEDQSDIPLFDTNYLDFNFNNLFRDNRFNGPDRVGDANQLTLALTSRILSGTNGRELLTTRIGQIYYFEDRRVTLDDNSGTDTSTSSVIADISTGIFDHWLLRAGVQIDPNADIALQQGLAQASYQGDFGQRLHASWRLREGVLEQTDLAAYWPVSGKVSLIGRWYYSVEESHSLETVAGLEYGDCCWRLRAVWRRYLDNNGTEYTNTALLQLELNGLGKLGNNIDNFLDRTIYGY
jgi:LPS-assembly protein